MGHLLGCYLTESSQQCHDGVDLCCLRSAAGTKALPTVVWSLRPVLTPWGLTSHSPEGTGEPLRVLSFWLGFSALSQLSTPNPGHLPSDCESAHSILRVLTSQPFSP